MRMMDYNAVVRTELRRRRLRVPSHYAFGAYLADNRLYAVVYDSRSGRGVATSPVTRTQRTVDVLVRLAASASSVRRGRAYRR